MIQDFQEDMADIKLRIKYSDIQNVSSSHHYFLRTEDLKDSVMKRLKNQTFVDMNNLNAIYQVGFKVLRTIDNKIYNSNKDELSPSIVQAKNYEDIMKTIKNIDVFNANNQAIYNEAISKHSQ
ncbi:2043_t:CDS:2, partial [Dentiscutata heterogama]